MSDCDSALVLHPGHADASRMRGYLRCERGDMEASPAADAGASNVAVLCKRGIRTCGCCVPAHACRPRRARMHCVTSAFAHGQGGISDLDAVLAENPDDIDQLLMRGHSKYHLKIYQASPVCVNKRRLSHCLVPCCIPTISEAVPSLRAVCCVIRCNDASMIQSPAGGFGGL